MKKSQMNQMIINNLGEQLRSQVSDDIKNTLADKYFSWLKKLIAVEAPALSGQNPESESESESEDKSKREA